MAILKRTLNVAGVGFGILILFIFGMVYSQATRPVSPKSRPTVFEIEKGMTLKRIAQTLGERQLIHSPSAFRLLAFFKNKQSQIHAGEFELSPSMTPGEILQRITSGQTILYTVTIPEGYRITEIAALFAEKGLVDAERFI
ncbi:MAG: endolytic transglycosylase MltG, partial [Nitrospinales bacterium]